jgi:hypothetical protein
VSRGISVADKVLVAMAAGCQLRDAYESGFKYRAPLYYRYLRHPDGRELLVASGTISKLAASGLIASTGGEIHRARSHDVEIALTPAGRARGAAIQKFDLDQFMNEIPESPEKKAEAQCRRVLRRLSDASVRILDRHWKGYKLVSAKPGFSSIYEPVSRSTFEACLPCLEKYREPGERERGFLPPESRRARVRGDAPCEAQAAGGRVMDWLYSLVLRLSLQAGLDGEASETVTMSFKKDGVITQKRIKLSVRLGEFGRNVWNVSEVEEAA